MKKYYKSIVLAVGFGFLSTEVFSGTVDVPVLASQSSGKKGAGVELVTGSDSSVVSITHKDSISNNTDSAPTLFYEFSLSAPVDKNQDLDPFGNLEGVVDGLAFEFEIESWSDNRRYPTDEEDVRKDELCVIAKNNYIQRKSLPESTEVDCADEDWLRMYLSASEYAEREWMFWESSSVRYAWGANLRVGNEDHKFLGTDSLQKKSEGEQPWLLGAYYIVAFKQSAINRLFNPHDLFTPGALTLGIKVGTRYKKQDEQTVCLDPDSRPLVCSSGRIGAPEEIDQKLLYTEYRSFIGDTAYSIRLTHDLESHDTGIDLPIYFLRDKENNWAGGVRFGWTNEDQGQASLFVGKSFSLY